MAICMQTVLSGEYLWSESATVDFLALNVSLLESCHVCIQQKESLTKSLASTSYLAMSLMSVIFLLYGDLLCFITFLEEK